MRKTLLILIICLAASTSVLAAQAPPPPAPLVKSDGIIYDLVFNLFGITLPQN